MKEDSIVYNFLNGESFQKVGSLVGMRRFDALDCKRKKNKIEEAKKR